jgi:hypothetical protein
MRKIVVSKAHLKRYLLCPSRNKRAGYINVKSLFNNVILRNVE